MLEMQFWIVLLFVLGGGDGGVGSADLIDATQAALQCVNDYMPVCARYGHEYLLFANKCDLMMAKREEFLSILHEVPLRFCVVTCQFKCTPSDEDIICGINSITGERKTFRNRCELAQMSCLSNSHWKLQESGICSSVNQLSPKKFVQTKAKTKRQPLPCTDVYRPVCATYAAVKSTFDNECLVNAENINTGKTWRVISQGICAEDQNSESYQKWQASIQRNNLMKTAKTKVKDRTKRSASMKNSEFHDFDLGDNTVYIYAPNAFETQFINSDGNIEKSYSDLGFKPQATMEVAKQTAGKTNVLTQSKLSNSQNVQNSKHEELSQPKMTKPCIYGSESVCGTFNKESRNFINVCALMDHSQRTGNDWHILHQGLCRKCKHDCEANYAPLCVNRSGLNYTLFNECYLRRVKCLDPKSTWNVVKLGECLPTPHDDLFNKYVTKPPGFYFTSRYAGEDGSNAEWELPESRDVTTMKPTTKMNTTPSTRNRLLPTPRRFSTTQLTTTVKKPRSLKISTTMKPSTTKPMVPTTTTKKIPTATKAPAYFITKPTTPRTTVTTETVEPVKSYYFIKNELDILNWKNSERPSIYGADSHSLMMRLARATIH